MSGALDPIQEDLPLGLPSGSGSSLPERASQPNVERPPSLFEQLWASLRTLPWARWRAHAAPVLRSGAEGLGSVARVAVKRGAPYTLQLAKATAQISLIRAFPLLIARTIHLFGFPAVVVRTAIQYSIAHRAGLAIDEVKYFRVDDPAGYTVYEAPSRLSTAIAITYLPTLVLMMLGVLCLAPGLTPRVVLHLPVTWVTWVQIWLGLAFAAHAFPSYEEAGPVSEQARVGVLKADPVSVFWVIPAQIVAILTRLGGIPPAVAGVLACWWLAGALFR
ncbi:MAG: hypothetical protein E6I74_11905 [Chloroflexi bacterium]|nr:MAG: hypothetical protein E6I74_11905 [Chloroflexota bacterium]